jgi:hypothetical protein
MKHLIFIDNDDIQRSKKDVGLYVTPMLQAYGNLDEDYSTNIEIISDLYKKNKDELYDLFYSGKNAILSWSVYTPTSFHNSNQQLLHFLRIAGSADVKGVVYLDMSGMVEETLSKLKYSDVKDLFSILTAIEKNNIVTLKDGKFIRLKLDLAGQNIFKHEDVVLSELLECNAVA